MTQEKAQIEKLDGKSMDVVEHNIEQLKELFPEVFAEGKISFDKLQELLGNYVVEDEDHYNFTWHGKRAAGRLAQTPSTGTLRPAKDESVDWDTTQNLFIEGDNLEVLKLLQKSYHRKVKMIYIDPPYNTGNEFVYKDDFKDGVKNYLETTGQLDSEGKRKGSNSSSAGRYHTNWLNMMYPRLKLARNLMRDDAVIFISIDDNENSNLLKLCDEMFGEENFVGNIIWKNVTDNNPTNIATEHEYVVVYAKSKIDLENIWKSKVSMARDILTEVGNELVEKFQDQEKLQEEYSKWFREHKNELWPLENYKFIDQQGVYSGERGVHNPGKEGYRYDILHPVTQKPCKEPLMGYRFPEETMQKMIEEGRIIFGEDEDKLVEIKVYAKDYKQKLASVFNLDGRAGANELKELFPDTGKIFTNPKTIKLLSELISFASESDDIVLDFFAGSASTGHAIYDLNSTVGENRKFISVQLDEKTYDIKDSVEVGKTGTAGEAYKHGYKNIADISKERIRRAAKKIKEENPDYEGDLGFKVFKLDSSNIKRWEADFETLEEDLLGAVDYIKNERSSEDVLYELLLKYGLDLTVPIETRTIAGKKVYSIGLGALVVCLEKDVSMDVVNGIGKLKEELSPEIMRVVFKDEGFKDDVVKTNALQTLKRFGIEDIKSL